MEIESDRLYTHDRDGDVVALSVHRVYDSYETDTRDGNVIEVFVSYAVSWDDYGPMPGAVRTQPVEQFVDAVTDVGEIVEFVDPDYEQE